LIAAGSVVLAGFVAPNRTLVAGTPATVKKALEGDAAKWVARGADDYVALRQRYVNTTSA
jgi:phenylacetic acid degradation protein